MAINNISADTTVNAKLKNYDQVELEYVWSVLSTKGQRQIESHKRKMEEVSRKIKDVEASLSTIHGGVVDLMEFGRVEAIKEPLMSKLEELRGQMEEFITYMDYSNASLRSVEQTSVFKARVEKIRKEFGLELGRFDSALPMYSRKSDIVRTITDNQVCIILGETGSGKSTQIMQYLHDTALVERGMIVCTQPRKIAAISLASRVSLEMGTTVGKLVGYQVGMQSRRGPVTKLVYTTDHALLNECLKDPSFTKYSCVVVDEAHERSIYSDLLLGFLKRALSRRYDLHVVIMSATINPELFKLYFAGICTTIATTDTNKIPPVLQISGRVFPVDVYYEVSSEDDYTTAAFMKALQVHRTEPPGDILVFLTSSIETDIACNSFLSQCNKDHVVALELHGKLQADDQQKVFEATPPGMRKIVFATNTAETSITIPGIKYVIDTGRVREVSYDAKKNMSILAVQWVTQSSAEQRKGRAGRTDCGKCYRLYTEENYNEFRKESVPEIMRVHLGQAMLKLMVLGVTDPTAFDFVQAPCPDALQSALAVLRELDAYDENGITEIGQKMAKLSLEPQLAKVALLGFEIGIPLESAVMAAVTTKGETIFFRAGSDDQKEQADRRKTRFCDEWGDIITLFAVYKEWDKVPENNRNRWCVENSINAKSMRTARDILNEIKQTFKNELGVTIPDTYSERTEVNEDMAKILFNCYSSNVSRFCGHKREGFCLAKDYNTIVHVYPSSAFNFLEVLPKWVVFEKVKTTSRTFMLNTTFVRESWIEEKIASGRLDVVPARFVGVVVEHQPLVYVGSQCIRKLLEKKAQPIKELNAEVKAAEAGSKFHLDIKSFKNTGEENNNGGTIEFYTTADAKDLAVKLVFSRISAIRQLLLDETVERPLVDGSSVRFVLERGAKIRAIMMPNEYRTIKITNAKIEGTTESQVRQILSKFGEIENVKISTDTGEGNVWGHVTFKRPQDAASVVAATESLVDSFTVDLSFAENKTTKCCQDTNVKVVTQRRPLRGFGYLTIPDVEDIFRLTAHTTVFRVTKPNGSQEGQISIKIDKKNNKQLFLQNVPLWCSSEMIRIALQQANPMIKIGKIDLPRGQIPPDQSAVLATRFHQVILSTLVNSDKIQRLDFTIENIKPREKDFDMKAFLKFSDSAKALLAVDLLNNITEFPVDATLDLKASFTIPRHIYKFCQIAIDNEIRELQAAAEQNIRVEAKQHHVKPGLMFFHISGSVSHDFVVAKDRLSKVLNGHRVIITKPQLSFLKSEAGRNLLKSMEEKMENVKVRVDDQQCAAFVHTSGELKEIAVNRLTELLQVGMPEIIEEVQLRDAGFPKGLMKALMIKYGSDLDALKVASDLMSLDLILRQHIILLQGSRDAVDKSKQLLRETAATLSQSIMEPTPQNLLECPVCLTPMEKETQYATESCGHVYCQECASNLVQNSLKYNDIPVRCAADGCRETLAIQDLRNLTGRNLERVYESAIRTFMMAHAAEYSYCITGNCQMIYRKAPEGNGQEFTCSACDVSLCTACNVAAHAGMTCAMYHQLQTTGPELAAWLEADTSNRAQCPKCKIGIDKDGGCMRVECAACHVHICWRCKEYFDNSGACYGHLTANHGGCF